MQIMFQLGIKVAGMEKRIKALAALLQISRVLVLDV